MEFDKIEQLMRNTKPTLTQGERMALWSRIEDGLAPRMAPRMRPKQKRASTPRIVTGVLIILGLVGGSTVTAFASESALPGDTLYPAKLAIENVQLTLAPVPQKKELQVKFAERRVAEVKKILDDVEEESDTLDETQLALALPVQEEPMTMALMVAEPDAGTGPSVTPPDVATQLAVEPMEVTSVPAEGDVMPKAALMRMTTPEPLALMVAENAPRPEVPVATSTKDLGEKLQKSKRWKKLDEKKKAALTIALKALAESEADLSARGAHEASAKIQEVSRNVEALSVGSTTPDSEFVSRMKSGDIHIIVPEAEEKSEATEETKEHADEEKEKTEIITPVKLEDNEQRSLRVQGSGVSMPVPEELYPIDPIQLEGNLQAAPRPSIIKKRIEQIKRWRRATSTTPIPVPVPPVVTQPASSTPEVIPVVVPIAPTSTVSIVSTSTATSTGATEPKEEDTEDPVEPTVRDPEHEEISTTTSATEE